VVIDEWRRIMGKHRVATIQDLPVGQLARVEADGVGICLAHTSDGSIYAINDTCTHEETSLSEGDLMGYEVECPSHMSTFDVRTGAVIEPPAPDAVQTYPVEVVGNDVYVVV
jgi:3-phenylpropionate/trans-cinnamate dioxygenase ferredoxin component